MTVISSFISLFSKKQSELYDLVDEHFDDNAESQNPLSDQEKELITNALQFKNVDADEVSVPRSEITYLKEDDTFEHILKVFQETRYSRLPVVGKDLDDVIGFITLKDIIPFIGKESDFKMINILRSATFVPDTMSISQVLQLMKKSRIQMLMVADEYGGTAGLLSLKDILEELVGEVEDEHEAHEIPLYKSIGINRYWIDAKLSIEDAQKKLNIHIPLQKDDDIEDLPYETMGGLVLHLAGKVPAEGERLAIGKHAAIITKSDGRRVFELELTM